MRSLILGLFQQEFAASNFIPTSYNPDAVIEDDYDE
jgi:hypothetical protein